MIIIIHSQLYHVFSLTRASHGLLSSPQRFLRKLKTDNVFHVSVVQWLKTELVVLHRCPERMCEGKLPTFVFCAIKSVHFTQLVLTYCSQEALVHQPWKQLASPPSRTWHPRAFKQLASSVGLIIGTHRAEWGGNSLFRPSSIHLHCLSSWASVGTGRTELKHTRCLLNISYRMSVRITEN